MPHNHFYVSANLLTVNNKKVHPRYILSLEPGKIKEAENHSVDIIVSSIKTGKKLKKKRLLKKVIKYICSRSLK